MSGLEPGTGAGREADLATATTSLRTSRAASADWTSATTSALLASGSIAVIAAGIAVFLVLRSMAPMHYTGWDEAYYLGIGADLLSGRGLQTVFGDFPAIHAPLWPLVLQAPPTVLGIQPTAWGHPLVILSGAGVIGMTAWFAWRSVRIAAPLAAVTMLAYPFLMDLAGWMGLDLPAALLTMLYVGLGIAAVRRGSLAMGLAAGFVFAAAFLIKELAVPFAPVPVLVGLVRQTRIAGLGRAAAGILLTAVLGTSWWFVVYAVAVGGVYRLGTPTWTLLPIAVAAGVLVALGLTIGRIAPRTARPLDAVGARRARRLGWALTLAWTGVLAVYFAVTPNPVGTTLVDVTQLRAVIAATAPSHLPLVAIAVPGAVLALVARWMPRRAPAGSQPPTPLDLTGPDDHRAIDDLVVATIVGLPFVVLVLAVGEGPRHYIAQLGFLAALGGIGWAKALAWLVRRSRLEPATMTTGGALLVLLGGSLLVMASSLPSAQTPTDQARASVVDTTTAWIRQHLPRGSAVVFGNGLAMETGLHLVGDYRLVDIQRDIGIHLDPGGVLGLRASDGTRPSDWVALWTEGRDATSLFGYRASSLAALFRSVGPAVWIETGVVDAQDPSPQLEMLRRTAGVERLAAWSWPVGSSRYETVIYRVDPSRLSFSLGVVMTPAALARMIGAMDQAPAVYRRAAADLLARVQAAPLGPSAPALIARLARVAGG